MGNFIFYGMLAVLNDWIVVCHTVGQSIEDRLVVRKVSGPLPAELECCSN